jgi:hypothetical protein
VRHNEIRDDGLSVRGDHGIDIGALVLHLDFPHQMQNSIPNARDTIH